ncbi:MAG: plastocyanin/azurin family copper-binding protein [Chitinophagaceae bacterium]
MQPFKLFSAAKYLHLIAVIFFLSLISANATIHIIKVSDFQFSPNRVNALVGDTIKWVWKSGFHTTTSTKVPRNAATWDAQMNSSSKKFLYTITKKGTYNYQCNIHPTVMMGTIVVTTSLSSNVTDFEIGLANENAAINWQTNSEDNIAYYSLQRSNDEQNFKEIARIKPTDIISQKKLYHFIDENISSNQYLYYMLETVDKSGNIQLSDIKMFAKKIKQSPLIVSLSPNPIERPAHLMIQFNADKESTMLIQLFNENGKFVKQTEMAASTGLNYGHFMLGDLPSETYYIVCSLGLKKEKQTIIVK